MKKCILIGLVTVLLAACGGNCGGNAQKNNQQTTGTDTETKAQIADASVVKVYYFHGKQRCKACIAVEKVFLPPVFAIATGLPVIIIAWLLAYSIGNVGKFYNNMKTFQIWFKRIVAAIFILTGVYYIITNI